MQSLHACFNAALDKRQRNKHTGNVTKTNVPRRRILQRIRLPVQEFAYVSSVDFTLCMMDALKINSEARSRGIVCEQGLGDHA